MDGQRWPNLSRCLRPATVAELEALRVYKTPAANTTAALIYHQHLSEIKKTSPTISAPAVLRDYFFYALLAEARRAESDEGMPEVAEYCDQRVSLFEEVFRAYWGVAQ